MAVSRGVKRPGINAARLFSVLYGGDCMRKNSAVIQSTSATSEQSAATAQELSDQSLLMNSLVSKFQLR
jgi:hypothetical protein